jgi:hypothetical protein
VYAGIGFAVTYTIVRGAGFVAPNEPFDSSRAAVLHKITSRLKWTQRAMIVSG